MSFREYMDTPGWVIGLYLQDVLAEHDSRGEGVS